MSYSRNCNNVRGRLSTLLKVASLAAVIAVGSGLIGAPPCESAVVAKDSAIVTKCKEDLATRLKLQAKDIKTVETKPVNWSDSALGMPEIDKFYMQVITPGLKVTLEAKNTKYLYTTSDKAFKYGGPVSLWDYSMLYLMPVKNDANFSSDLYQCSLLGTNPVRILSEVSDYYPQEKGIVIAKRRTSRSFHDLLYVKADGAGKPKTLYTAMDFGEAALNPATNEWAGFVRPGLGSGWKVVIAKVGSKAEDAETLGLPEGVNSGEIAWVDGKLMILAKKGIGFICYEISLKDAKPEWKEADSNLFPGVMDYVLNKSQTLVISQIDEQGKPTVEVAVEWFTGDRDVKAKISNLTLRSDDLFGGYAFINGEQNSRPAVYTVDLSTEEVIPGFHGTGQNIKPFLYPPQKAPIGSK